MRNKEILLIRPPMRFLACRVLDMIDLPLGLLYIGANLEKHGWKVRLVDGVMPESEFIDQESEVSENYFGVTFEEIEKRLRSKSFDVACLSAQYTVQFDNVVKLGTLIKKIHPDCHVLVGGAHVSVLHREIISQHRCFDVAIRGEGEYTTLEVINALSENLDLSKIRGITCRIGKDVVSTEHRETINILDDLPYPAYHLVDMEKYFRLNENFASRTAYTFPGWERGVSLITSRGCPYECSFCSIHLHMGRKWRYHSHDYILRHMDFLVQSYGVRYFHFEDDNLTANPRRFERILDGLIERPYEVRWDTPNGVRADTFTLELMKKCRETGCTFLIFGVESGVQRVLDQVIRKKVKIKDIERAARLAMKANVNTRAFYLIGNPGERHEEIQETVNHALRMIERYDCFGGIGMTVPLYGTTLFQECVEKDYLVEEVAPERISESYTQDGLIKTEEFTPLFLKETLALFSTRAMALKKKIFIKRILRDYRLLLYVVKNMLVTKPSRWGSIYNKVIFFNHAITRDMELKHRKDSIGIHKAQTSQNL